MTKIRYYLLLLCLVIVGVGAASIDFPGMPKRERLVHTAADALMIGAVLAMTVDVYLKKWLLKEAALDVFQFMLGYQLPRGVTDRIKSLVQNAALIRRDCELHWSLSWVDEKKERLWVYLEVTYVMENASNEDRPYQQRAATFDPNDATGAVELMWFHSSDPEEDYQIEGADLQCQPEDGLGNKWCVAPVITIPSRNRERDLERKFGAKYLCQSNAEDDDEFVISHMTLDVHVVIDAPEGLSIKVDPEPNRRHLGKRYDYSRLFVDNEVVTLRWVKKPPDEVSVHKFG